MAAFWISLALVFAAEFGDKTQLVALALATRYRPLVVLGGITVATLIIHALSVFVGRAAGAFIPANIASIAAGLAFIGFGVWTLRGDSCDDDDVKHHQFGPFVSVLLTVLVSELGDKTMLATAAIASQQQDMIAVWLGSSTGMILADAIVILVGQIVGKHVPESLVKATAAGVFFLTGVATIARAAFAH